jgi:hypothetical protein
MIDRTTIIAVGGSLVVLLVVLELVRQRKLREEYSLLWLITAIVLLILSVSRPLLDILANAVGIFYPPSALFLVALAFVMFILLHFSTVLTRLAHENKELAQQMALLRWELEQARAALTAREQHGDQQHSQQDAAIEG